MFKRTLLPLLAGVALAGVLFAPVTARASHCFSYCPDYAGYIYVGCTVYMDENDDISDVDCQYVPRNIAEERDAA